MTKCADRIITLPLLVVILYYIFQAGPPPSPLQRTASEFACDVLSTCQSTTHATTGELTSPWSMINVFNERARRGGQCVLAVATRHSDSHASTPWVTILGAIYAGIDCSERAAIDCSAVLSNANSGSRPSYTDSFP